MKIIISLFLLFLVGCAAVEVDPAQLTGLYSGAAFVYGVPMSDPVRVTIGQEWAEADIQNIPAADLRIGYRASELIAIEGMFQRYTEGDIDITSSLMPETLTIDYDAWAAMINAKVFTPMESNMQGYLIAGAGAMNVDVDTGISGIDDDATELAIHFGLGADYYFTQHFSAMLEVSYLIPTGDIDDFTMMPVVLGLQYHF